MTDQQTAATDNALVEKLGAWNIHKFGGEETHRELRNPDGPEAAERIKSLLAEVAELTRVAQRDAEELRQTRLKVVRQKEEVERLKDSRTATADFTMQVVADRQRIREALEFAAYHWTDKPTPTKLEAAEQTLKDIKLVSLAALNPAIKEANDEHDSK